HRLSQSAHPVRIRAVQSACRRATCPKAGSGAACVVAQPPSSACSTVGTVIEGAAGQASRRWKGRNGWPTGPAVESEISTILIPESLCLARLSALCRGFCLFVEIERNEFLNAQALAPPPHARPAILHHFPKYSFPHFSL